MTAQDYHRLASTLCRVSELFPRERLCFSADEGHPFRVNPHRWPDCAPLTSVLPSGQPQVQRLAGRNTRKDHPSQPSNRLNTNNCDRRASLARLKFSSGALLHASLRVRAARTRLSARLLTQSHLDQTHLGPKWRSVESANLRATPLHGSQGIPNVKPPT